MRTSGESDATQIYILTSIPRGNWIFLEQQKISHHLNDALDSHYIAQLSLVDSNQLQTEPQIAFYELVKHSAGNLIISFFLPQSRVSLHTPSLRRDVQHKKQLESNPFSKTEGNTLATKL